MPSLSHTAFLLAILSLCFGPFQKTWAATPSGNISVHGEALICVVPDKVVVNLGVEHFDANLDESKRLNDTACARLIKAVKALGITDKDIQTEVLSVELKYRNSSHPSQGIEGYYTRRSYSVTFQEVKKLETLIDSALKSGANRLMGVEFKTNALRKHRDEARVQAIRAAKEKAAALAKELDCTVGAPTSISEGYYGYSGGFRSWWGGGGSFQSQNYTSHAGAGASSGESLPLGQIGIRAQINVNFQLIAEKKTTNKP